MARYGKQLLQRLTFQYCDRMGSSQGMREYIEQLLPAVRQQYPQVQVLTLQKRNHFPSVKAEYALLPNDAAHLERQLMQQSQQQQQQMRQPHAKPRQKPAAPRLNSNVIGVKHLAAKDIQEVVWWLSQSQGRPKTSRIPSRHIATKQPSIQGTWTPSTFAP